MWAGLKGGRCLANAAKGKSDDDEKAPLTGTSTDTGGDAGPIQMETDEGKDAGKDRTEAEPIFEAKHGEGDIEMGDLAAGTGTGRESDQEDSNHDSGTGTSVEAKAATPRP